MRDLRTEYGNVRGIRYHGAKNLEEETLVCCYVYILDSSTGIVLVLAAAVKAEIQEHLYYEL